MRPTKLLGLQKQQAGKGASSGGAPGGGGGGGGASIAKDLMGQYKGFTLTPLSEHTDSSFDSIDDEHPPRPANGALPPPPPPTASTGVVQARAQFFSGAVKTSLPPATTSTSTALPAVVMRPAPSIPAAPASGAGVPWRVQRPAPEASVVVKSGPTEILITRTAPDPAAAAAEAPKASAISIPASMTSSSSSKASTLQKVASLFKSGGGASEEVKVTPPVSTAAVAASDSSLPVAASAAPSVKANKINRESLRQLEISNPIPQTSIDLPSNKLVAVRPAPPLPAAAASKLSSGGGSASPPPPPGSSCTLPRMPPAKTNRVHFANDQGPDDGPPPVAASDSAAAAGGGGGGSGLERSGSMKLRSVTSRPSIPHFGSMRAKRPLSVPFARPKSPPPPVPGSNATNPQQAPSCANQGPVARPPNYDLAPDTEKTPTTPEAIYASIEDLNDEREDGSAPAPDPKRASTSTTRSDESSVGLLSEIVSELKKKNMDDAVYSVSNKKPAPSSSTAPTTTTTPSAPSVATPGALSNGGGGFKPSYQPYSAYLRSRYLAVTGADSPKTAPDAPAAPSSAPVASATSAAPAKNSVSTLPAAASSAPKQGPAAPVKSSTAAPPVPKQPPVAAAPSATSPGAKSPVSSPVLAPSAVSAGAKVTGGKPTKTSPGPAKAAAAGKLAAGQKQPTGKSASVSIRLTQPAAATTTPKVATSPANSVGNSSLANSLLGRNSSHVLSMQQKFDSSKVAKPAAPAAGRKVNPKR